MTSLSKGKTIEKSNDNKLIYLSSIICHTIEELEKNLANKSYQNEESIRHLYSRLVNLKNKFVTHINDNF